MTPRSAEDYPVTADDPLAADTGCLVLPVFLTRRLHGPARALDEASDGQLSSLIRRSGMRGRRGESRLLFDVPGARADRVLLVGCGARRDIDARRFQTIAAHAARALGGCGGGDALSCLGLLSVDGRDRYWRLRQLIEAVEAARYRFDECRGASRDRGDGSADDPNRSSAPDPGSDPTSAAAPASSSDAVVGRDSARIASVRADGDDGGAARELTFGTLAHLVKNEASLARARRARDEALATAQGTALARDLGNRPPGRCTPTHLADTARELAARHAAIETDVLDEGAMRELGMGAVLAVSRGSVEPAAFIVVRYRHPDAQGAPEVLVGKGVTFDSGGLSLKPPAGMQHMKLDMGGAAAVLGAIEAVARLALPIHVIALVAAVENLPGPGATRPGDVVTTLSGSTVEVLNTDAEGRLVLADALAYAARLEPATVIDVATLTGAASAALGRHVHALFSSSRSLTRALLDAGREAHDRAWPMPLMEEYRNVLRSDVADLANVGGKRAGAVVAACFLWRFAKGLRWAHLDVAGTASDSGVATGRPVPLLVRYLIDRAAR